ncbi:hydroxysqualene dehydroxylase HpnE [Tautonia plasticadhaerens]|uniref:15-cis-phytoene desaturase n=1 Tax=Tautonia plasticadhaerens TaxID=2527974 RepID=A0A518H599_9BACT|nr:hydroxysqualene dehydroxylase HpnE [Tautonia plasticadhaerens]QDV36003.1 15-cis-phytoene desaturase [Tautonia plasticadhaerens]
MIEARPTDPDLDPPAAGTGRRPSPPRVVVVGGGLAGLAAASRLVRLGLEITLLESRPRLGGRASSFVDPATGEPVDNCQHVSMACCTNLADFCRRVGTADLFRRVPEIVFLDDRGRTSRLRAGPLPAPMHLTGSFLAARYLTFAEKLRVGFGMACLRFAGRDRPGESFDAWLRRHGQTDRTIERFWGTVLVSALNERLDRMDVGHARKVFLDGFLRNRTGFRMEIPTVPLGELYGVRLRQWLEAEGVEIRLKAGVRSIEVDDEGGAVSGVTLRSGKLIPADFVVLAVPYDRVRALVPDREAGRIPGLDGLGRMESSPITGVHFWFDRPVCPPQLEHAVTVGRLIQWVFNHSAIQGREPEGGGQYLQLVISASYDLLPLDKVAIRDRVLADLASIWPSAREARLLRWWAVTEHGATFSVRPGVEGLRPDQRTPIDGLFLSGDWTATGWPATMEGAVRSGYLAAEGILADLGLPRSLVRPDLPTAPLARLLLGRAETRPPIPPGSARRTPLAR